MTIADDVPAPRFIGPADDVLSASIVLASASMTRRMLLEGAGVPHIVEPSRVDEDEIKISLRAERASGTDIAEVLAEAKAMYVSRKHPEKMVLGADQVLECDGETFDKPVDRDDALSQLQTLRGKRHSLISYAVISRHRKSGCGAFPAAFAIVKARHRDQPACQMSPRHIQGPDPPPEPFFQDACATHTSPLLRPGPRQCLSRLRALPAG